jgi:putative hydrolases of HD superfamily
MDIIINSTLLKKLYDAAYMQRWNDKIRPVELTELDKQAHKMIIAYMLGKLEDDNNEFNWVKLIEGGLFEFLQRLVVTDLKPQVLYKIKEDLNTYRQLNTWVYMQLEQLISPLGNDFCARFKDYFTSTGDTIEKKVLSAAHFYATKWEFNIVERADPAGYEMKEIKADLQVQQEQYYDLKGIQQLALSSNLRNFIDLCGLLRFQLRWSRVHRVPKTSVLGHMLIVAIISYLFSLQLDACPRRCINNYFTGLFHDLPEALTKDIISPVKHSIKGLNSLIKKYEKEQMRNKVYPLIPDSWRPDIKMFTENEFRNLITIDNKVTSTNLHSISQQYNSDEFNPRDGELVKAIDEFSAFLEAYLARKNGIECDELKKAELDLRSKYRHKTIGFINFGEIYSSFQ